MLSNQELLEVIQRTPLVSIDLVARDSDSRMLLGLRMNEPAKDTWFVPGGRILKDESLDDAFTRITRSELGIECLLSQACFLGLFTHSYKTNFLETPGIGTHYVVIAYQLESSTIPNTLPTEQHRQYRWWSPSDAACAENVHRNVLPYFLLENRESSPSSESIFFAQYEALNNRRNSFNQLLWQAPALSLTALAFLFSIIFSKDVTCAAQQFTAWLAFVAALASIQLLTKPRFGEVEAAKQLTRMERSRGLPEINTRPLPQLTLWPDTWLSRIRSYWVWLVTLGLFGSTSLAVIIQWPIKLTCS
jgi:colanic acid biosynthesis protein WcaH